MSLNCTVLFIVKMSEKKRNLLADFFARVEKPQRLQDMNKNAEVINTESITTNDAPPIDICSSVASLTQEENQPQQAQVNVNKNLITWYQSYYL